MNKLKWILIPIVIICAALVVADAIRLYGEPDSVKQHKYELLQEQVLAEKAKAEELEALRESLPDMTWSEIDALAPEDRANAYLLYIRNFALFMSVVVGLMVAWNRRRYESY